MKVVFRSSFLKDVRKIRAKSIKELIYKVIENCENAKNIADIDHCLPLQSRGNFSN